MGWDEARETRVPAPPAPTEDAEDREWRLLCPECGHSAFLAGAFLYCPSEGRRFARMGAILPLLSEKRRRELELFLDGYRRVRRAEGWGGDARYYRELPFADRSGRHRPIWRLRARSYRAVVAVLRRAYGARRLRALELGAGNCWFSSRLARLGHFVLATDVSLDEDDGLSAFDRYREGVPPTLDRAQAHMEELPLAMAQFDLVVANGSIHYARDLRRVVRETHRVLRSGGMFCVLDSPTYRRRDAGETMIERRIEEHRRCYGVPPDPAIQSGYLLLSEFLLLLELEGFRARVIQPFPGVERTLRSWLGWLPSQAGFLPPAMFPIFIARKVESP